LSALEQYPEALVAFEQGANLRSSYGLPDDPVIFNSQGLTLLALGKPTEALAVLTKAIALDPNYATPWSNKGWALSELGNYQESLEAYDQAIELDPNSANTWYNRGVTLYQLELDTEAIACFEKALAINPNYQPALEALDQLKSN
jgi:tetratricopeptide (TPR) repeat protein